MCFSFQSNSRAKRTTNLSRTETQSSTAHWADNVACGNVVGHFRLPVEVAKHVEVFTAVKRDSAGCPTGCPASNWPGFEKNRIQLFRPRQVNFSSELLASLDCLLFSRCANYDQPLAIRGVNNGKKRFPKVPRVLLLALGFLIVLRNRVRFLSGHFISSF